MTMKASSSSIWSNDNAADKAIDGIITPNSDTNMFHSAMDKHAWFVVDLGNYFNVNFSFKILENISEYRSFSYVSKVYGVSIVNRREVARGTNNIQARVGFHLPPEQGTNGDTIIKNNPKCGDLFVGPALDGETTTIITCHG